MTLARPRKEGAVLIDVTEVTGLGAERSVARVGWKGADHFAGGGLDGGVRVARLRAQGDLHEDRRRARLVFDVDGTIHGDASRVGAGALERADLTRCEHLDVL